METNAKIACWEKSLALYVDPHTYETVLAAQTGGRVRLELAIVGGMLMVGLTPDREGVHTLTHTTDGQVTKPYRIEVRSTAHYPAEVMEHLKRFGMLNFELSGSRAGLSGEIDLVPHLRPWPKLRPCKAYDYRERSVEVYKERMLSCAIAGDVWTVPPSDFMAKCPKSFMTIWGEMPEGLELRMEGGHVHRR